MSLGERPVWMPVSARSAPPWASCASPAGERLLVERRRFEVPVDALEIAEAEWLGAMRAVEHAEILHGTCPSLTRPVLIGAAPDRCRPIWTDRMRCPFTSAASVQAAALRRSRALGPHRGLSFAVNMFSVWRGCFTPDAVQAFLRAPCPPAPSERPAARPGSTIRSGKARERCGRPPQGRGPRGRGRSRASRRAASRPRRSRRAPAPRDGRRSDGRPRPPRPRSARRRPRGPSGRRPAVKAMARAKPPLRCAPAISRRQNEKSAKSA